MQAFKDLSRVEAIQDINEKLLKACMPKDAESHNQYPAVSSPSQKVGGSEKTEEMKRLYKARIRPFLVTTYS